MINEQAKHAAVARLQKAMDLEKIKGTFEVAGYLGLNPIYVTMFKNVMTWEKCPAHAFERLLLWCNSGSTLKGFKAPDPVYKGKEKKLPILEISDNPPDYSEISGTGKAELMTREDLSPVQSGQYVDPVELLVEIAKRLPANVKVVITINNEDSRKN